MRGHSHRTVVAIMWMWTALVCIPAVCLLVVDWKIILLITSPFLAVAVGLTLREFPSARYSAR